EAAKAAGHGFALFVLHFFNERLENCPFLVGRLELLLDPIVHALAEFFHVEAAWAASAAITTAAATVFGCILSERHDGAGRERERGQEEFGCDFHCCRLLSFLADGYCVDRPGRPVEGESAVFRGSLEASIEHAIVKRPFGAKRKIVKSQLICP